MTSDGSRTQGFRALFPVFEEALGLTRWGTNPASSKADRRAGTRKKMGKMAGKPGL